MYSDPLAYFITWSCYGCRVHGDPRGSVDRRHNAHGTPTLPANDELVAYRERSLRHPRYRLDQPHRVIVEATVRAHCTHRGWPLHAVHARTEHVHLVASSRSYSPEIMMEQFKAWATRRLREAGLLGKEAPAWAEHGSTRYVWTDEDLFEAVDYVMNRQGGDLD